MRNVKDVDIKKKKIIIRCDFNVPMKNGMITDDTRIKESLNTLKYLIDNDCKIIILSHLGKVKEESDKKNNSLLPVSIRLSELLNQKVLFSKDTRSEELTNMAANLQEREILLIENTRYEDVDGKKESGCDLDLAKYWASLGEFFVNDAYGTCHRAHASNVGVAKLLPNAAGFLVEKEINKLDEIINENTHPFVVIMGGGKVEDKIKVINNLITKCDKLLIGGRMAYTFLKASNYNVGKTLIDESSMSYCQELLKKYKDKIILPIDTMIGYELDENTKSDEVNITDIKDDQIGLDIGSKTIDLFKSELSNAKRVIINGPLGIFEIEKFANGTKQIYKYLSDNNIKTLIGGGDSAAAVNKFGFKDKFYHVSTGGGATLEYLEGTILPGISVIENGKEN